MSDSTTARLAATKRLYLDAQRAHHLGDEPARRQAVIGFDVAIEDALETLTDHLGRAVPRRADRPQMCEVVKDVVSGHALARRVRQIRNPAMHNGYPPTVEQAEEAARATLTVLKEIFHAAGHDFDRFTVVSLLHNPLVREPLEQAQASLGDPTASLGYASLALRRLEGLVQEAVLAATNLPSWYFLTPRWADQRLTTECADAAAEHVERLLATTATTVLTRDLAGLVQLRMVLSRVHLQILDSGSYETRVPEGTSIEPEDAWWAVDFIATMAYQVERSLPDLRQRVQAPREVRIEAQALPIRVEGI